MITLGKYSFDGPFRLEEKDLIDRAAIYTILCWNPSTNDYAVIYIGQSGELGTRLSNHNKKACWDKQCSGKPYVAIYYTPANRYSKEDRLKIETELITQFGPVCNKQ